MRVVWRVVYRNVPRHRCSLASEMRVQPRVTTRPLHGHSHVRSCAPVLKAQDEVLAILDLVRFVDCLSLGISSIRYFEMRPPPVASMRASESMSLNFNALTFKLGDSAAVESREMLSFSYFTHLF